MTVILRPSTRILSIGAPGLRITQPGGGGAPANGLLNNLIAYWPGNEAAGNALDLHTNALHLTQVNTVGTAAGNVYATARQYTSTMPFPSHDRPGDDALLSTGDVDFTLAAWVYLDSLAATSAIAGKASFGAYEYWINAIKSTNVFRFHISSTGANEIITFGVAATTGAWHLVVGWHDSVANTINVEKNANGTISSAAHAGGVFDSTSKFRIGNNVFTWGLGRIGPTMFWKSAAGGGGVLTAAQRTALYNAGAGLPYASFTV